MKKGYGPVFLITLVTVFAIGVYGWFILWALNSDNVPFWIRTVVTLVFVVLCGTMITAAVTRKEEIDGGEEDDLGKY